MRPSPADTTAVPPHRGTRRDLLVIGVWFVVVALALVELLRSDVFAIGELEALVPVEHRSVRGEPWLLVRVDEAARASRAESSGPALEATPEAQTETILLAAAIAIEESLGPERVPIAPPRSEIARWLDAHALYLLPVSAHPALKSKLGDESMLAEIVGLKARMSSPLFAAAPEQPRRDPLDLRVLAEREPGSFGHVETSLERGAAQVTASGDLLGDGGQLLLIQLRSTRSLAELRDSIVAAVQGHPVAFELLGPDSRAESAELEYVRVAPKLLVACFAALVLVMAVVLRRLVPVLALVGCVASIALLVGWGLGPIDLPSLALLVLLLGFACDAALDLPHIGLRGWASKLIVAGALLPLLVSPYPLWQRWAAIWAISYLGGAVILRAVLPAMLRVVRDHGPAWLGHDLDWRLPGFRLTAMPVVAVLVCVGVSAGGVAALGRLDHRPAHLLPVAVGQLEAREAELRASFFDPALVVEARTVGPDAAAALDAAAAEVVLLSSLVPAVARRIDSPGSFVLPSQELEARRASLKTLELPERMLALDGLLANHGLRAEAFSEFVRGATDIEDLPSAQAALDGPLGPWIDRYADGEVIRSRVELVGEGSIPIEIGASALSELPILRGPAIAAIDERVRFDSRLGLMLLIGLWLLAFWVWVGTGSLGLALAVALVSIAGESGVLIALALLDQPIGAHLVPALLLVGASTGVAAGRSCRAVALDRPLVARGLLLAGLCQVVAGLVLLSSGQPLWREIGLMIAIGCMLGVGLGLFVAPGVARVLTRREQPDG